MAEGQKRSSPSGVEYPPVDSHSESESESEAAEAPLSPSGEAKTKHRNKGVRREKREERGE